jgi:hypothetical protein
MKLPIVIDSIETMKNPCAEILQDSGPISAHAFTNAMDYMIHAFTGSIRVFLCRECLTMCLVEERVMRSTCIYCYDKSMDKLYEEFSQVIDQERERR